MNVGSQYNADHCLSAYAHRATMLAFFLYDLVIVHFPWLGYVAKHQFSKKFKGLILCASAA